MLYLDNDSLVKWNISSHKANLF